MANSVCQEVGLVEPKGTKVDAQVDPYFTSQCKEDDVVNGSNILDQIQKKDIDHI